MRQEGVIEGALHVKHQDNNTYKNKKKLIVAIVSFPLTFKCSPLSILTLLTSVSLNSSKNSLSCHMVCAPNVNQPVLA